MWIGLLWYFNFVQIPNMSKIPDEQKPAIGKVIAPAALFYFRWAAALTIISGLILGYLNGYLHDAMTLSIGSGIPKHTAIGKVIAPAALFYFRWAALLTIISGFILAHLNGYLHDAMTLGGGGKSTAIGIGMWLGLYMAFNVWFIIWPNQKRALGIVECEPEAKAKSAKTAMLFSRTNTLLSLPMLLSMVAAQNLY